MLFSSYDQQTVDTHFRWMAENGIDTAALQRFDPVGGEGPVRNAVSTRVMNSAQTYGVKFYIMYDCSSWPSNPFVSDIESDWTNEIIGALHLTNSPMYALQNGKPVVCIWGFGFNDGNHPWPTNVCINVINYFKSQGCYVMGGVPTYWRTGVNDSQPNFLSAYSDFDMISPWMVGRIGNTNDSENYFNNANIGDITYCTNNGIDYQPCILPGDTGQRTHGNLMWFEFANFTKLGVQGIYISMFDEFNEGNQIACSAENASMIPTGSGSRYLTLGQDGAACSSDYYLRLTGDGGRMLKGQTPLTYTRPTVPMLPLVFPSAPAVLTAQNGNAQVTLTWSAVTGAADVTSYNVMRATVSDGPYLTIATNVGHISYTDTGVTNNTTYYYVVSAVNSLGVSANSPEASALAAVTYAVNSGGGAAGTFSADAYFSGGSTSSTSAAIDTSGVTNPAPQAVYQAERWGNNTYTFPNLNPGRNYVVRLHFAEIFFTAAGKRQFNVLLNGTQVLTNYDIFADAGTNNKAVIKEYTVAANGSGQIVVQYVNIPGEDNAKSSGIEVLPITTPPPPPVPPAAPTGLAATAGSQQVALTWNPSANTTGYNVKRATNNGGPYTKIASSISLTSYTDAGLTNGTVYYYVVSALGIGGESTNSPQVSAIPAPSSTAHIEGDLIVNLQSSDLNSSVKVWTNRTGNANSVGNFTTAGGGNLNVSNLTWNSQTVKALYVNQTIANAVQSALVTPMEISSNSPVSAEAWIYATAVNEQNSCVIGYGIQGGAGDPQADREFNYDLTGSGGGVSGDFGSYDTQWATPPAAGAWHYLAWTWDGATVSLYLDGALNTTHAPGSPLVTPQTFMGIGAGLANSGPNLGADAFQGYIACARVESGVLTANDISANYTYGLLGTTVSLTSPQLTSTVSDGVMQFNWPADHTGWRLEAQTNSSGVGLGNNWTTVSGSTTTNQIFIPINTAAGTAFFRLVYP